MKTALAALLLVAICTGCWGPSQNYKAGVSYTYPIVAARGDNYSLDGAELRASARPPISFERARAAWEFYAPGYRSAVEGDESLTPFRREQWLETANEIDQLQEAEADYQAARMGR